MVTGGHWWLASAGNDDAKEAAALATSAVQYIVQTTYRRCAGKWRRMPFECRLNDTEEKEEEKKREKRGYTNSDWWWWWGW